MTAKQIMLSALLITIVIANNAIPMNRYRSLSEPRYSFYPSHTTENNPETYEAIFKKALKINLSIMQEQRASEDCIKSYEISLLKSLKRNKEIIIRRRNNK